VNLLTWLTSNKYADKVAVIHAEKDKLIRDKIKATLPAITPSGEFSYRAARCLIAHSGFIAFDVDLKGNSHIKNYKDLKTEICKIMNVAYCGLSVSGTGYWGLIPIAYPDKHEQHFDFICNAFKSMGITIDPSPRNVASLRGYSHDPQAYFNHHAKTLNEYHKPVIQTVSTSYDNNDTTAQGRVEVLINELTHKRIDLTSSYKEWLSIGFALTHEFGRNGRQYFHDVSRIHPHYNSKETDKQYNKCLKARKKVKQIKIGTFFKMCEAAGITLPKKEKDHLDDHAAIMIEFNKWMAENKQGGIFQFKDHKFQITPKSKFCCVFL
jgi:hypothetical protein